MPVTNPTQMNETFASAFNSRKIDNLTELYELSAILCADDSSKPRTGMDAIRDELKGFLMVPGTMRSTNNFCIEHGDIALLRADWQIIAEDETIIASGSSAEIIRKQPDGRWLYMIDHAIGASLPRSV
jgi:ketosteroid isomerase-like protein